MPREVRLNTRTEKFEIAVIGGTGALGAAVAGRLSRAGFPVTIGSRDADRAAAVAATLNDGNTGVAISSDANRAAAASAEIVFLCVPFDHQLSILDEVAPFLHGKLLIDTTVPLMPPRVARVQLPPEGSAALRAQQRLGEAVEVVSTLHNVAAAHLDDDGDVDCDVLVFGEKRASRQTAIDLIEAMGLKALHGGALANSAAAEALTSVLIFMNRHYASPGAGIRITRLEPET